jgi:hypothetical protein
MDMNQSVYTLSDGLVAQGTRLPRARWVDHFVLLDGLHPATEIFRVDETFAMTLVTDALAARVMQAGCSGVEFRDPTLPQRGDRLCRYRTASGVAERWIGVLD